MNGPQPRESASGHDDVGALRAEVTALRERLREMSELSESRAREPQEDLHELADQLGRHARDARDQMRAGISEHPLTAAGIALAAGVLVGAILLPRR